MMHRKKNDEFYIKKINDMMMRSTKPTFLNRWISLIMRGIRIKYKNLMFKKKLCLDIDSK